MLYAVIRVLAVNRQLRIRGNRKGPIGMNIQLERRRREAAPDTVTVTSVTGSTALPDGSIGAGPSSRANRWCSEHLPEDVTTEVYRDGQLVQPRVNPEWEALQQYYDPYFYGSRSQEARELLDNFDEVMGQDAEAPTTALLAALNEQQGVKLGYFMQMTPAFREHLLRLNEIDPQAAALVAIQKANSITDSELSQWMTHKAYRAYREKNRVKR